MDEKPKKLIDACVKEIDQFYEYSFRMPPEETIPFVIAVFTKLEELSCYITPVDVEAFQNFLKKTMEYMEKKDYVLMRDCLHYEIRSWLQKI